MPTDERLERARVACQIAVTVLGPSTAPETIEGFALTLMSVPTETLSKILVALPGAENVDSECLPDRPNAWERLRNDPES